MDGISSGCIVELLGRVWYGKQRIILFPTSSRKFKLLSEMEPCHNKLQLLLYLVYWRCCSRLESLQTTTRRAQKKYNQFAWTIERWKERSARQNPHPLLCQLLLLLERNSRQGDKLFYMCPEWLLPRSEWLAQIFSSSYSVADDMLGVGDGSGNKGVEQNGETALFSNVRELN